MGMGIFKKMGIFNMKKGREAAGPQDALDAERADVDVGRGLPGAREGVERLLGQGRLHDMHPPAACHRVDPRGLHQRGLQRGRRRGRRPP